MHSTRTAVCKLLQTAFLAYVTVAMLYTTNYFIVSPISCSALSLFGSGCFPSYASTHKPGAPVPRIDLVAKMKDASNFVHDPDFFEAKDTSPWDFLSLDEPLHWTDSTDEQELLDSVPIREETFLSKAFSQSMHPTKIIPYYYKASAPVEPDDVTITTLVTSNRYKVLKQLVERYQGPMSVTIHIPLPPEGSGTTATRQFILAVRDLETLYASSPHFATHVDVHLALSPFSSTGSSSPNSGTTEGGRQFNVWRNVARLFARTEFVMMLDVDFAICTDWRSAIRDVIHDYQQDGSKEGISETPASERNVSVMGVEVIDNLREGRIALVLPAFEYIKQEDGVDQSTFPRDKESLIRLTSGTNAKIATFHASWAPGHNSTDYGRYFSIPPGSGEVYKVTQYQSAYEPYVIMSKRVSWCDERFTGYGGNKAACLFELYLSGVNFYVMTDHFLIHQSHKYEEEARREERKYNRKLYADFKEEACLRYLYRFKVTGELHAPVAANAIEECKKLKAVAKVLSEFLGEDI